MQPDDHVPLIERLGNEVAALRKNMAILLRNIGDPGYCTGKACRAEIFWLVHRNGKRTPYTQDGANHFIDCPDREQFRRNNA